jgi:MFS family permease
VTHSKKTFVWLLSLAQLVSWGTQFYGLSVLMQPIETALHLSRSESSLAFSIALTTEGLLAFVVGRAIDRGHERVMMCFGSLLAGVLFIAHSLVQTKTQYYALWFGIGVAMSCTLYAPAFAVLTRRFPQHYRRAIITLTFLGGLASTVMIPTTAALIAFLDWRQAFVVLGLMHLLICLPLHWYLLKDAPQKPSPTQIETSKTLGAFIKSTPFLGIAIFSVLMMGITAALPAHLVNLLKEAGINTKLAIALPASVGLLQVAGRLLLYFFESRFDVHLANRLIPMFLPLGLSCLLLTPLHISFAFLFVLFYGLGNGMLTIVKGTAIATYVNRDNVGALNGIIGLPQALARGLFPYLLGLMWTADMGYRNGLLMLISLTSVAIVALMVAQKFALKLPHYP